MIVEIKEWNTQPSAATYQTNLSFNAVSLTHDVLSLPSLKRFIIRLK